MLFKFCEPKYNPLNGAPTFRLGTLEYYRAMDPSFAIADANEGVESYKVDYFQNMPGNEEARNYLERNGVVFSSTGAVFYNCKFVSIYPNCYIWCCRRLDSYPDASDGAGLNPGYSSFYQIPDIRQFCLYMSDRLRAEMTTEIFTDHAQKHIKEHSLQLDEIDIVRMGGPVLYVEEKLGRFDVNSVGHYANLSPELRPLFVKTSKYTADSEFRFVFAFVCPKTNVSLSVRPNPLDVKAISPLPII